MYKRYRVYDRLKKANGGEIPFGVGLLTNTAASILESQAATDQYNLPTDATTVGTTTLRMAGAGAALGSAVPGVGTAVGAAAGGLVGLGLGAFQANKIAEDKDRIEKQIEQQKIGASVFRSKSKLGRLAAADPNFLQGNTDAQLYAMGGKIKAMGGDLIPINSNTVEVSGNTHAAGGVDIGSGVEVEDNETIAGDFVFSDKLGFAKEHKKLARAIGKIEKKPDSLGKSNALDLLRKREQALADAQETIKQDMVENPTFIEKKMYGGKIKSEIGPGSLRKLMFFKYANGGRLPELDEDQKMMDNQKLRELVKFNPNADPNAPVDLTGLQFGVPINGTSASTTSTGPVTFTPGATLNQGRVNNVVSTAASLLPNVANAFRRLPTPPVMETQDPIAAEQVDYSNQAAEARRSKMAFDTVAERNLTPQAATAAKASSLISQIRETNRVREAESNTNAALRGEANKINAGIEANNIGTRNQLLRDVMERSVTSQQMQYDNLASVAEKIQRAARDQRMTNMDYLALATTFAKDLDNASWRELGPVLKGTIPDELWNALDTAASSREQSSRTMIGIPSARIN